jgi:hypothetical protein
MLFGFSLTQREEWRFMGRYVDQTGKTFGRLTCLSRVGTDPQERSLWLCECSCGNKKVIVLPNLTSGVTKSCGCLQREVSRKRNTTHSKSVDSNGNAPRLYGIWRNMKQRCYNPKATKFEIYGGRGISVCDDWRFDYMKFHVWSMSNGYADHLSIDRIEGDDGYYPENCRWISVSRQNMNKNNNRFVVYNGQEKTLMEWSKELGIKFTTLKARLDQYGWSVDEAFNKPVKERE